MKRLVLCAASLVAFSAATLPLLADDLLQAAQQNFKPIPSAVPAVKGNTVTREKVELGKMLFFDPRLSASQIISCDSCHNIGAGGVEGRYQSERRPLWRCDRCDRRFPWAQSVFCKSRFASRAAMEVCIGPRRLG